jgi:hypothetical protein
VEKNLALAASSPQGGQKTLNNFSISPLPLCKVVICLVKYECIESKFQKNVVIHHYIHEA